jgi:hypothetical protein
MALVVAGTKGWGAFFDRIAEGDFDTARVRGAP